MHTRINSLFVAHARKWGIVIAVAMMLCGLSISPASSAVQERELVAAGSLRADQERAYAYAPVSGRYSNIFRGQSRTFSVVLIAQQRGGKYVDDEVGVYELTNPDHVTGLTFPIRESGYRCCSGVEVLFERRDGVLWFAVSLDGSGVAYETAVKKLYALRAQTAIPRTTCGRSYLLGFQGGAVAAFTYFDPAISRYLQEPPDNLRLLAPLYVIPTTDTDRRRLRHKIPIADTGCWLYFNESDSTWYPTSKP